MNNIKRRTLASILIIAILFLLIMANYTFSSGASTKIVSAAELRESVI